MLVLRIIIGAYAYHRCTYDTPESVIHRLVQGNRRIRRLVNLIQSITVAQAYSADGFAAQTDESYHDPIETVGSRAISALEAHLTDHARRCSGISGNNPDWSDYRPRGTPQAAPGGASSSGHWPEAPTSASNEGDAMIDEMADPGGSDPLPSAEEVEEERYARELDQALVAATEHDRRMAWERQSLEELMWWLTIKTCAPGARAQMTVAASDHPNDGCEVAYELAQLIGLLWPPPAHLGCYVDLESGVGQPPLPGVTAAQSRALPGSAATSSVQDLGNGNTRGNPWYADREFAESAYAWGARTAQRSRLGRFSMGSTVVGIAGAHISAPGGLHRPPFKEKCRPGTALQHPMMKESRDCTRPRSVKES